METKRHSFEWLIAEALTATFEGWDFGWLQDRMVEEELPWSYADIVSERMRTVDAVIDLGTGGGEYLAALLADLSPRPARVVATEAHPPNVEVARRRLKPLGVEVVPVDAAPDNIAIRAGEGARSLPFRNGEVPLVIDRHESYYPAEVFRILERGGTFITQQVGGRNLEGLNSRLRLPPGPVAAWDLAFATAQLEASGFRISRAEEAFPDVVFRDIGAVVYFLDAVPWQAPGFTVDAQREALEKMHSELEASGGLRFRGHCFLVEAIRP